MSRRLGLVHALKDSIEPTEGAVRALWPEAEIAHLFDGSLYLDRSRGTASAAEIDRRVGDLIVHSASCGVDGILFTGSFFGAAVAAARPRVKVPVLASFDGLIEEALAAGRRLAVLATAEASVGLLADDLRRAAAATGREVEIARCHVAGALEALIGGDRERHDALVAAAAAAVGACDAILLGQFTMGPAAERAAARSGRPVLTAPEAGVRKLRRLLEAG